MSEGSMERFRRERERLNELVLERAPLEIKRFFSLDGQVYREGALAAGTKEMLGLVASLVLRCDDCVRYHLDRLARLGARREEVMEAMSVALVVGGSIVIPHLRRAVAAWAELESERG